MNLTYNDVQEVVESIFPQAQGAYKLVLEGVVLDIIEGKDIGKFRGDISIFKQQALDTAAAMPRPVLTRRGLEKDAGKKLSSLVDKLERSMLKHVARLRAEDPSRQYSPTRFRKEMKADLMIAYQDAYKLGTRASGVGTASPGLLGHSSADEKKWVDNVLRAETVHFNKLLDALIKGESMSKARIRIRNYANAVRSVYEGSRVLQLPDDSLIHWVLQSNNPCSDCRLLHRLSPYTRDTLPTTPKAGSTRCLSYCFCKFRIVKAKPSEVERVRRKNKSAKSLLDKLKQNRKRD